VEPGVFFADFRQRHKISGLVRIQTESHYKCLSSPPLNLAKTLDQGNFKGKP
jgi:hypothetical protein